MSCLELCGTSRKTILRLEVLKGAHQGTSGHICVQDKKCDGRGPDAADTASPGGTGFQRVGFSTKQLAIERLSEM